MKKLYALAVAGVLPAMAMAQAAVDAYQLSHSDLRGTARFMSMGGAFTALGGDMSTLNQNPAGIGIYRSSEIGLTLNLNFQSATTEAQGVKMTDDHTKFTFNNFGYIGTTHLYSDVMPTFSWGATYSRTVSMDRVYRGGFGSLDASLSNLVAAATNSEGWNSDDLSSSKDYNPYVDSYAPWLSILSCQGFVINPDASGNNFQGLMGDGTTGSASYAVRQKGYIDEYAINFGGNIYNTLYWGLGFGITDIDFTQISYYDENLDNAYIAAQAANATNGAGPYYQTRGKGYYRLDNYLNSTGTGFNVKFGLIFKPINELRIGFAVHTPTWYQMTDTYYATMDYRYTPSDSRFAENASTSKDYPMTNDGYESWNDYDMRTPWRMMVGVAGVIGGQGILSLDYEYRGTQTMKLSDVDGNEYTDVTSDVKRYYKGTNILRLGAEYRVTPQFSLRAGYSYESSPVKEEASSGREAVWTAGTIPSYTFDKTTQYITCGLGFRTGGFYADLAYVHKRRESSYHAFSPLIENGVILETSPTASLVDNNNQVVLSIGYKF